MRPIRAFVRIVLFLALCLATIVRMILGFAVLRARGKPHNKTFDIGPTRGLYVS